MREYIDKGNAIFALSALPLTLDAETTQRAIEAVRAVPAADVKPILHGKWMTKEYHYGDAEKGIEDYWVERPADRRYDVAYCSVCGAHALLYGDESYAYSDFCPNCGADMREGQR